MTPAKATSPPPVPPKPRRSRVKAEAQPSAVLEDERSRKEKKFLSGLLEKLADEKNARVAGIYIDTILRFVMAFLFFWLAQAWLTGVLELLGKQSAEKTLSDPVLIALLTTTTINVLAMLAAVAVYLFPRKSTSTILESEPTSPPA